MRRWLFVPLALLFSPIAVSADSLTLAQLTSERAGAQTIDFDSATPTSLCWSCVYVEDGFRISVVSGHYDIRSLTPETAGDQDMTVDNFGAAGTAVRLDFFGHAFDLLSFDVVSVWLFGGTGEPGDVAYVTASDGRRTEVTNNGEMLVGWQNVSWVEFGVFDPSRDFPDCLPCATGGQDGLTFDNIRVAPTQQVPEPASLALLGVGAGTALIVRRRRQESTGSDARQARLSR
jgi:hypothetical protein